MKFLSRIRKLQLHWQILIALILSVFFGIFYTEYVDYVTWMGDIFLRALTMVIVPLIFSSIVIGVTGLGSSKNLGRLGLKTFGYYLISSLLAILVGLILVNLITPGVGADIGLTEEVETVEATESFGDTLIGIVPSNIIKAMVEDDLLSIIFFALLFGFFTTRVPSKFSEPIENFFNGVFEVMIKITMFVIRFSPLGIFGIVSGTVAEQAGDPETLMNIVSRLGMFMVSVILGLAIHSAIVLPLIMKFVGGVNPLKHFRFMSVPLLAAFSTSSSSATLPLNLEAVKSKSGVSTETAGFVLPLGATINMNGTALYECVAVLFIAQAYGVDLALSQQIIVVVTALLASIGAAGIPMAGLVVITIILRVVGLPLEGVGLILAVERILDMFRTTVNIWRDSCGAVIIAKSEGEELNV